MNTYQKQLFIYVYNKNYFLYSLIIWVVYECGIFMGDSQCQTKQG